MTKSEMDFWDTGLIGPGALFLNQYFNCWLNEYYVLWLCLVSVYLVTTFHILNYKMVTLCEV